MEKKTYKEHQMIHIIFHIHEKHGKKDFAKIIK